MRQWAELPDDVRMSGQLADDGFVPKCPTCTGVLKADVTFFGESLPAGALTRAVASVVASSVLLGSHASLCASA